MASGGVGAAPFIQRGCGLSANVLNKRVRKDDDAATTENTFALAASLPGKDLGSLVSGPKSIGSRFYANYNKTHMSEYCGAGIPSAEFPRPSLVAKIPHFENAPFITFWEGKCLC